MAPLHHENLVRLYGGCWSDGPDKLCIVLELCKNGSLDGLLRRATEKEELSWSATFSEVMRGVASCFKYLHFDTPGGSSLVHRDLKPGNVLLSDNFAAKIADFGESTQMRVVENVTRLTMTMVGTPMCEYIARPRFHPAAFSRACKTQLGSTSSRSLL